MMGPVISLSLSACTKTLSKDESSIAKTTLAFPVEHWNHETALRLGCLMSINPDAHSTRELDLTLGALRWPAKEACRKDGC
jgi:hypothetical protein